MKFLKHPLLLCLASIAPLHAATFIDFEDSSYGLNTPLTSYGWTTSESSPSNQPLAWVGSWNGKAGAIGGWYNNPTGSTFTASVATPQALAAAVVSFDLTVADSTNDYYNRDTFGITVTSGTGSVLATITLTPAAQSISPESGPAAEWFVSYMVAGGSVINTGLTLLEGVDYSMSLVFNEGLFGFSFGDDTTTNNFSTSTVGYNTATQSIGGLTYSWTKYGVEGGDNFMAFDNISVVPEPSAALLAALTPALFFIRRRRNS